ncbi:hypothetical protein [Actinomadura sp. KC216]|nr:hypothetical protein [Actinomadura sp. KC216]
MIWRRRAVERPREYGPVHAGGPAGLFGRSKRDRDGRELNAVHAEDERTR